MQGFAVARTAGRRPAGSNGRRRSGFSGGCSRRKASNAVFHAAACTRAESVITPSVSRTTARSIPDKARLRCGMPGIRRAASAAALPVWAVRTSSPLPPEPHPSPCRAEAVPDVNRHACSLESRTEPDGGCFHGRSRCGTIATGQGHPRDRRVCPSRPRRLKSAVPAPGSGRCGGAMQQHLGCAGAAPKCASARPSRAP
ncbi:hypothetical protein SAFG77S_00901 [Streptomyces afghaniensis]